MSSREEYAHGTVTGFTTHGCRCPECSAANRAYQRQWQRDRRGGRPRLVDAAEARRHLRLLRRAGVTFAAIEGITGISDTALARIADGHSRMLRPANAEAILGVGTDALAPGHLVPAQPTRRMLRELSLAGVTRRRVALALGQTEVTQVVGRRVRWSTHRRITTLYRLAARRGLVRGDLLDEVTP